MITSEQNEYLCRTGPGTPMGNLFRRYWIPALMASELPGPDCPPVRVQLLSERLIAFRDTEGRLGLMDEYCAHRGVSLWFGRNEEGGLRCPYHGWKYDVTGQCTEVPSEPATIGNSPPRIDGASVEPPILSEGLAARCVVSGWYDPDGKMMKKKNTFLDFISAAEFLVKEKYTSEGKIAIQGGSAGCAPALPSLC